MSKIKTFITVWEHEHQTTLKVFRALPEAQFHFKESPSRRDWSSPKPAHILG